MNSYVENNLHDSTTYFATTDHLFAQLPLGERLSEDTAMGRLLLQSVNYILLAPSLVDRPKKVNSGPISGCAL